MQRAALATTFCLPVGYKDVNGNVHKDGILRQALQVDREAVNAQLQREGTDNPIRAETLALSRVIVKLGSLTLTSETAAVIVSGLAEADITLLALTYQLLKEVESGRGTGCCPTCHQRMIFEVQLAVDPESGS